MYKILIAALLLLALNFGCVKQGQMEFVQVVYGHEVITAETVDALVRSIESDIDNMRTAGILTEDMEQSAQDLVDRLELMKCQSIVISDYIDAVFVDKELMSRLVRAKWQGD